MPKSQDVHDVMASELQRRLDCYNAECKPGGADSPIKPMTFKQFLPALIISIILTVYLIAAMVAFPAFYPG